jgi:hypothetical protein
MGYVSQLIITTGMEEMLITEFYGQWLATRKIASET